MTVYKYEKEEASVILIQPVRSKAVYLSLGDREEKKKNPVMCTVDDCIRKAHAYLAGRGTDCTLEWNAGNHFKESELRTAKAFAWVMKEQKEMRML